MSDAAAGPGWWQASDGKWYPPEAQPGPATGLPPPGGEPFSGYRPPGPAGPYGPPGPYGGYPPSGYPPMGYPVGPPRTTNSFAIASMIVGIVSLGICYLGWIAGIVAIVLGVQARRAVAASEGRETGDGMALAGIITGSFSLLWLLWIVVLVATSIVG